MGRCDGCYDLHGDHPDPAYHNTCVHCHDEVYDEDAGSMCESCGGHMHTFCGFPINYSEEVLSAQERSTRNDRRRCGSCSMVWGFLPRREGDGMSDGQNELSIKNGYRKWSEVPKDELPTWMKDMNGIV